MEEPSLLRRISLSGSPFELHRQLRRSEVCIAQAWSCVLYQLRSILPPGQFVMISGLMVHIVFIGKAPFCVPADESCKIVPLALCRSDREALCLARSPTYNNQDRMGKLQAFPS